MRAGACNLEETYEATAVSVPRARRKLAEFARAAGAAPRQVDDVRLAASEAVTNAVLHAYDDEPGSIYVHAAVESGKLWILISDDGCGLKPRADRSGLGLGLGLISQVSDDFAVISRACGGVEVRIRFNLANATADGAGESRAGARRPRAAEARRAKFTASISFS